MWNFLEEAYRGSHGIAQALIVPMPIFIAKDFSHHEQKHRYNILLEGKTYGS